jgi:peptidoglycan hydrolase-like protein with peptidoglycan-binding domain
MATDPDSWFQKAFHVGKDVFDSVEQRAAEAEAAAAQKLREAQALAAQKAREAREFAAQKAAEAKAFVAQKAKDAAALGGPPKGATPPAAKGNADQTGPTAISGSVGRAGRNKPEDVKFVQRALGLNEDGKCGPQTIGAIERFQKSLGQAKPDGRIDPGGPTLRALLSRGKATSAPSPASSPAAGPEDEDSSLFDKLAQGASRLADEAKGLGGKILRGAEDLADDAKSLGGKVLAGAGKAANDPKSLRSDIGGGNSAQEIADRLIAKIKADADLRFDLAMLSRMEMRTLLDVMSKLKEKGKLEDFADRVPTGHDRVGVAIFTIRPEFDVAWQKLVKKLSEEDRKAVLERTPKNVRAAIGFPDPVGPQDTEHDEDGDGTITVESFVAVQAKLEFKSKGSSLGKTEFTVKLAPDGSLGGVEVDLTVLQQKFKKMGPLAPILDLEGTLSLNAEVELDEHDRRTIFDGVQAAVKGEVQLRFKQIPLLKKVIFKLSVTAGTEGAGFGGVIEIPIPGT